MRRFKLAAMAALAIMSAGCSNSAQVRYKVIVEVDDKGAERSGSSVWSWILSKPTVALGTPYDGKFKGEAVEVDLGGGRRLYALLKGEDGYEGLVQMWPERLFEDLGSGWSDRVRSLRQIAPRVGESRVLPRWSPRISNSSAPQAQYPMLVTFSDLRDPSSLQLVDPEHLERSFGAGVSLKAIKVVITDEPVTTGISARLPWLDQVGRSRSTLIPNPPRRLREAAPIRLVSPRDFSTELYK